MTITEGNAPVNLVRLRLFLTGQTATSRDAVANLRRVCEQGLLGDYDLQIIDVLEHPQQAEEERILATPTLIKEEPPPRRRIIGDLSDASRLLRALSLPAGAAAPREGRTE